MWWRRRVRPPERGGEGLRDAQRALVAATARLEETQGQAARIERIVRPLILAGERNHFADLIESLMSGGGHVGG